jgi:hypothetical protein
MLSVENRAGVLGSILDIAARPSYAQRYGRRNRDVTVGAYFVAIVKSKDKRIVDFVTFDPL